MPGMVDPLRYADDTWGVLQLYQRHLLQVGFVDTWAGRATDPSPGNWSL